MKEFNPNEDRKFTIHDLNNGHKEPLRIMEEQMGKQEGKGAEGIREFICEYLLNHYGHIHPWKALEKCNTQFNLQDVVGLLTEYASLPANKPVTDEEIEAWATAKVPFYKTDVDYERTWNGIIIGAKAHRDRLITKK